ncbi:unnamed protein product [Paramecium sonneborni]|uniref:Uncharacterized protein n=1 Tax=Paramecium sonneborni TaxID=65129 RepID=A0A8S1RJL7_9CILI|nr:unnamed protein product [Paramecium sonneborni]
MNNKIKMNFNIDDHYKDTKILDLLEKKQNHEVKVQMK